MADTDHTADLQRWIDARRQPDNNAPDCLQPRTYVIKDTLRVGRSMGLRLAGAGGPNRSLNPGWDSVRVGTILEWQGPPDKPMIEVSGSTCLVLQGLNLVGLANQGILIRDIERGSSLNIAIRDCSFLGMAVGIQCGVEQGEQTCANIDYTSCVWEGCTEACVRLCNMQSLEHDFFHPKFIKSPVGIDVVAGGDVSIRGGGSYEMKAILRLGGVASNSRGFDIASFRVDGDGTRTKWLTFADKKTPRTYGPVSFRNMAGNAAQLNSDGPLFEVAPGSRVVCEDCSFHAEPKLKGGQLAHIYSTDKAAGEFHVVRGDGLAGDNLKQYVTLKGPRSYYDMSGGNIYGPYGKASNFPEVAQKP